MVYICGTCKYYLEKDEDCLYHYYLVDILESCPQWERANKEDLNNRLFLFNKKINELININDFYKKEISKLKKILKQVIDMTRQEEIKNEKDNI